jgi:hypothetical protein
VRHVLTDLHMTSMASSSDFYFQCMAFTAIWWILVSGVTRRPLYHVLEGSVVTVPAWMPERALLLVQRWHGGALRPLFFYAQSASLALAFSSRGNNAVAFLSAILYSLYHLVESSETNRHGEYPVLYSLWAMCLVAVFRPEASASNAGAAAAATTRTIAYFENEAYRQACVWGVAIHFAFSAGHSKLAVSGWTSWLDPGTVRAYLTCHRRARDVMDRPAWMAGNRLVARSKVLSTLVAFCVLASECVVVPASLLLAGPHRPKVAYLLVAIHVGTALLLSFRAGFSFWTTIPVYLYGFSCPAEFASAPWFLAVVIAFGPTVAATTLGGCGGDGSGSGGLALPDSWPWTPVSLFMWDGPAADALSRLLVTGDTRLVLATPKVAANGLVGLRVLHQGERRENDGIAAGGGNDCDDVVHDAVMRTVAFTLAQGGGPLIEVFRNMKYDSTSNFSLSITTLVHRTWAWLGVEQRLFDARTGDPLTCAYFVRIDASSGDVKEVLV